MHPYPNYTQIPNIFFEEIMSTLNLVETRVLLVIYRKTFGWHKTKDRISLSQLEEMTGSSRTHINTAVESLESKGLIIKEVLGENGNQKTFYEVLFKEISTSDNLSPPQSQIVTPPSDRLSPTKETLTKETNLKETKLASSASQLGFRIREPEEVTTFPKTALEEMTHVLPVDRTEKIELHKFLCELELKTEQGNYVYLSDEQKMQIIRKWGLQQVKDCLCFMEQELKKGRKIDDQVKFFFWAMNNEKGVGNKIIEFVQKMNSKYNLKIQISDSFVFCPITGKDVTHQNVPYNAFVSRFEAVFINPITSPNLSDSLNKLGGFSCV